MIQDFIYFFHFYLRFNYDFLDAADNDQVHAMLYPSKFQMTIIYISLVRKLPKALQFPSIVQSFEHDIGLGKIQNSPSSIWQGLGWLSQDVLYHLLQIAMRKSIVVEIAFPPLL